MNFKDDKEVKNWIEDHQVQLITTFGKREVVSWVKETEQREWELFETKIIVDFDEIKNKIMLEQEPE